MLGFLIIIFWVMCRRSDDNRRKLFFTFDEKTSIVKKIKILLIFNIKKGHLKLNYQDDNQGGLMKYTWLLLLLNSGPSDTKLNALTAQPRIHIKVVHTMISGNK